MPRPIEAVVFDMDGVLIDSEPLWREVEREVAGTLGIDLSDEDLERAMGVRINQVVDEWFRRWRWDKPSREDVERAVVEGVARAVEERGVLQPGAVEAVNLLRRRGLPLAIASSSPYRLIEAVLGMSGLVDRFDVVHSAEDEALGKPDPAVFLTTARKLGVASDRCLAIEDSANGVRAAKTAGMVCVAVPERAVADGRFHGADLVLASLSEVGDWMWEALDAEPGPAGRP